MDSNSLTANPDQNTADNLSSSQEKTEKAPEKLTNIAIPFVTFNETTKKFIINAQAKGLIAKEEHKKIGILSLVGKYRTGKSFLLNRVILGNHKAKKGFDVGPTIKPCTKGIWLWSTPLIINNNYSTTPFPAFLIDTEGLGAYDEEINHDSKIFLISILISSLFIYNSFGTIDEQALNNLSLILNLSKSLKIRNSSINSPTTMEEEKEMAKYFPSLLWLLRDFALKLEDSEGNVITAKQYLENALMEQKGSSETIEEKNLVRKLIKTYFIERDCFPMVRPVENENDLQNLMKLPDDKIRKEFLKQSDMLKNKIYMKIKPKNFNGKLLSGPMLIDLLESIINAINEGAIPVIENSWNYIASNECLKCIKDNTEYFRKMITIYQRKNISSANFFLDLQNYSQSLIEEIVKKFSEEKGKKFDDINEFVHKLKLALNQEFKKLNEENITLLKDKYTFDLEKEINLLLEDKEKVEKENYINFIANLMQIKYKLDATIPEFSLKEQISYDKIIDTIKKYIESYFVKPRNSIEQQIQNLKIEKQFLEEKYKNICEEYNKDKAEFKQTVNKYNDMLIESKLRIKTSEEKIKNFENEKKTLKETNERTMIENNKGYEEKVEKLTMEINKLKSEVKAREEDLLVFKLNTEKVSALDVQKIEFLEKEVEQWKERYGGQNKELSENKSHNISLTAEIDKLKTENRNLKNKLSAGAGAFGLTGGATVSGKDGDAFRGSANNFFPNSTMGSLGSFNNSKLLIELLSGQNAIKDMLKEIMGKTDELLQAGNGGGSGKKKSNNNISNFSGNSDSKNIINENNANNNNFNNLNNIDTTINNINNIKNNINNIINSNNTENINNIKGEPLRDSYKKSFVSNYNNNSNNINNNNINLKKNFVDLDPVNQTNPSTNKDINNFISSLHQDTLGQSKFSDLEIKITSTVLKKDITGKPFLDYVCEIKNGNDYYKLNKKFGHFMMLHKALKSLFKDLVKIPDGGNLFININDMKQNAFHENKLEQLDKYISELLENESVKNSMPFRNFFELDEPHEQKIGNPSGIGIGGKMLKSKLLIEKKKILSNKEGGRTGMENNMDMLGFI